MRLLRLALLLMAGRCAGLALSHWDLEGANGTCDGRSTCAGVAGAATLSATAPDAWRERNCMCDGECARYGDCCLDSAFFAADEQRRAAASFSCVELRQFGGVYMVAACPPAWRDQASRARCERPDDPQSLAAPPDPLSAMPVTSALTNVTYRNAHCAACHGDMASARLWRPRLECPPAPVNASADTAEVRWEPTARAWGLGAPGGGGKFRPCSVDPVPPAGWGAGRRCEPSVIRTCASDWARADVRARCDAYTALVFEGSAAYRNPHCAVCNNVPLQYLACSKTLHRSLFHKEFNPGAFALLLDVGGPGGTGAVGRDDPCAPSELWDPFFKRCRRVLCPAGDFDGERCLAAAPEDSDESAGEDEDEDEGVHAHVMPDQGHNGISPSPLPHFEPEGPRNATVRAFATCPKFVLAPGEYTVAADNNSVHVAAYGHTFATGDFRLRLDGGLEVCAGPFGQRYTAKFPAALGWASLAGLGLSELCLLLHLAAFCAAPALRNPAGRALASLAAALLLAYGAFLIGLLLPAPGRACAAAAAAAYYGFVAAFAWSLAVAFDVWRSLRVAARELRVRGGSGGRRFAAYSAAAWLAAAALTALALWADAAPPSAPLPADLRPLFGAHVCWFGHRRALLIFFATPLALVCALNALFFAGSARVLAAAGAAAAAAAPGSGGGPRRDFRLYLRLALVMGLSWASGLAAGYLDVPALWYAFVALCSLQGVFLFVAFTLSGRGRRALAAALPPRLLQPLKRRPPPPGRRPASFSWSGLAPASATVGSSKSQLTGSASLY